ncbi:hypothetical protein DFS34DRAFT_459173 [Phlyctochytrium arcticum]|nr:hypothetical protein DFS34DRAFT_459173 [Phlyctochytrium arcticum]
MPNTVAADVASSYDSAPTSRQDDEIDQDLQQFFDLQAAAQTPIDVLMETPIDIGSLNKISPPNIPDPTIPVESPDILGQLIGGESALIKPKQVNHLKLQDWNAIGAMQAVMNLEMPPVSDAKLVDSVFFRPPLVTDDMRDEKELSVLSISADIRVKDLARDYLGEPEDPHSENQSVISDLLPPIPEDAHHMNDEDLLPIPENEHCRNDEILDVDTLPDEVEYVSSQLLSDEMKIRNVTGASDEDLQESQPYADLLPRPERKAKSPIEVLEYEAGVQIMQSLDEPPMNSNKRIINPQPFSVQRSLQDFLFHRGQRTVPAQDIGDDDVVAVEQVGQAENASHSSPAPAVQPSFEPPFFDPAVAAKHVYIAGRSLLANRELLRALECDYGVTVVERDLECYRPSISQNGSYREVDLILDERTCVIYYPLSNIALLSPRPVKNVADATKSVEKLSEIDLGNLLLRSVLRYSRIILVLEGVVNPPLPLLSPPVVRAWNALAGFSAILKDVFGVEGVRMELSVSARQSAWIARNAADKIAAMYAEPNVSIHSRPWPSKEAYENRSWLALQETPVGTMSSVFNFPPESTHDFISCSKSGFY